MIQSLQKFFSHYLAPTFHGMTLSQWYSILQNEKTSINWSYFYRIPPTTFKSITNSILARIEKQKYQTKYENLTIKPPIFILGHWRSGTTLLQNILANDHRFAYPNLYQTTNPKTFLLSEETVITKLFSHLVPKHRLFDHVPFGLKSPHEDEFIAWHSSGLTPCMGWNFPDASEHFDRYLTFQKCTENEKIQWKQDLITFLKKLTYKYDRPVVLKSPPHTARIKLLLDMFPEAKFIHIYRDPYRVYQSTYELYKFVYALSAFQKYNPNAIHHRIIQQFKAMYDSYFNEKILIPENQLIEIRFEDFESDPFRKTKDIYNKLSLPEFEIVQDVINKYLTSINNHKKNSYSDLDKQTKGQIYKHLKRNFQIWEYEQ